jgi:hypothetical protein
MPIKKSSEIGRETDSRFTKSKSTQKLTNIAERFDDSTDNDNPFDDALQYVNKKIDECIDVVNANDTKTGTTLNERSRIAANHAKVGITTSQASAISTNSNKTGITDAQAGHITANNDKVTNSNQSKADINALDITEVGTISSGVWQGTTIKTAYIGDDQVTEDKLADTLLAEIDANTGKNTNVVGNLGVVANGTSLTITTANGSNIAIPAATTSAWGIMTDDLVSAIAANTAKDTNSNQSKADINALDITEVGTISSGVWQGTTIKTAYIGDDQVTEDKLANTLLAEIDANTAKVGTTSTERSRIAANHAKVGTETTLSTTEGLTLRATVTESRGTYTLRFTMVTADGRTTKTADITMS